MIRVTFSLVLFLASFLLPFFLLKVEVEPLRTKERPKVNADHYMNQVRVKLFNQGHLDWNVLAQSATSEEDRIWNLNEISGHFEGENGFRVDLKGAKGLLDINQKKVDLLDGVSAKTSNNYKFKTEALTVAENERKQKVLTSNAEVYLYNLKDDLKVYADSMKGNIDNGFMELAGNVRCQKSVKNYKNIKIQSEKAEIVSSLKSIKFSEDLNISQENFKIRGQEAYFVYDDKAKNFKSVKIDGDILASDGVKTALSDSVEMRTNEDVIIFQGNPRIRVGKNEMVGEEILITNQQKNVQVIRGNIKSTKEEAQIGNEQ